MPTFDLNSLLACCKCDQWAREMQTESYSTLSEVLTRARSIWWQQVPISGWYEAFAAHPSLGVKSAGQSDTGQSAAFLRQSETEQSAIQAGSASVLQELTDWNQKYAEKFGHVFLFCALGRPSEVVLAALKRRYESTPFGELREAAQQQMLITEQRLKRLWSVKHDSKESQKPSLEDTTGTGKQRSPVTCHVLDTTLGQPAAGLHVTLSRQCPESRLADDVWFMITEGPTNADGRVEGLMQPGELSEGTYRVKFDTDEYCSRTGQPAFYPQPCVDFTVTGESKGQHFHIPLLVSPYAYSTYRGS